MPTTCPRCGTTSSAASEACRDCGHDLYRVSYPTASAATRLNLRALRAIPMTARITVSAAVLVVGTGVATGLLVGGEDEPVSKNRVPVTAVPRDPPPTPRPSSPKPSKSKTPPAPAPVTTAPPSPSPTPSPTKSSPPPIPGLSEAEWALELAEELQRKYGTPSPSDSSHWEERHNGNYQNDGDYQYEESYDQGYDEGSDQGYEEGYDEGSDQGYEEGYDEGGY